MPIYSFITWAFGDFNLDKARFAEQSLAKFFKR